MNALSYSNFIYALIALRKMIIVIYTLSLLFCLLKIDAFILFLFYFFPHSVDKDDIIHFCIYPSIIYFVFCKYISIKMRHIIQKQKTKSCNWKLFVSEIGLSRCVNPIIRWNYPRGSRPTIRWDSCNYQASSSCVKKILGNLFLWEEYAK